jgi:hypothetical protein
MHAKYWLDIRLTSQRINRAHACASSKTIAEDEEEVQEEEGKDGAAVGASAAPGVGGTRMLEDHHPGELEAGARATLLKITRAKFSEQ